MELKNISVCDFMKAYNSGKHRSDKGAGQYANLIKKFAKSGKDVAEVNLCEKKVMTCYRCLSNERSKNKDSFGADISIVRRGSRIFLARKGLFEK